jgi:hypothetical protein
VNQCGACGENFGGLTAFDAHRVGKHEYTYSEGLAMTPPVEDGRRCLPPAELELEGFTTNARGSWSKENTLLGARRRLGADSQASRAILAGRVG